MARTEKTLIIYTDDIDGEEYPQEQIETVAFGLDGKTYEIDLNPEHARQLRDALDLYISHGRLQRRHASIKPSTVTLEADPKVIRAWARKEGIDVPARGRIPMAVMQEYLVAHT